MGYVITNYYKNLPFRDEISVSFKTLEIKKTNQIMKVYHFTTIDSTITICDKWPKLYVSDKVCYAFIANS